MLDIHHTTTSIPESNKPRVVVIGGGFGGLRLLKKLKNKPVQSVLFDKKNHHTFQPLLYQVATSGLESSSIIAPFRKIFQSHTEFYFRLSEVVNVRPVEKIMETSIGSVSYDYLVIATGSTTNFFGMKDIEENSSCMKNIVDAIKLRNKFIRHLEYSLLIEDVEQKNSLIDFVIVGGGPTGVELAGALSELKKNVFPKDYKELDMSAMDIHIVESSPRLLSGMSESSSAKAKMFLEKMGVILHLNTAVKAYDGYNVLLSNGEKLISSGLIWAAGVKGNPIMGLQPDCIVRGNRLAVDEFNRVKGYDDIFAIGDIASMTGDPNYPNGHPMMAPPAMQQGDLLATNVLRLIQKKPMIPFRYKDEGVMATIGRNKAVVDMKKLRLSGTIAWYVWMFVHLMAIVGFRSKVFTFFSWAWNYFSFDRSNRLIIGKNEEILQKDSSAKNEITTR